MQLSCAVLKRDCDSLYLARVSSVLLRGCSCTAVRVCLCGSSCVDSLCSQLTSFSHPPALKEGVEWDCCPWSLEAYV